MWNAGFDEALGGIKIARRNINNLRYEDDITLMRESEELGPFSGEVTPQFLQWRNNSRKNEGMEPKQEQYPAVDVTGDRSKVRWDRKSVV